MTRNEDITDMITKYVLLTGDCALDLSRVVTKYLEIGCTLHGDPFVSGADFYQAVIKTAPAEQPGHSDRWIPVEDWLPPGMTEVIVTYEYKGKPIVDIARYNGTSNRYYPVIGWYKAHSDRLLDEKAVVTHWQPFPEAPKRGNT
jgi:hypothetical protein